MYGLVNRAAKDLITKVAGAPAWEAICKEAKVPDAFVAMDTYDDSVTYDIIDAASAQLDVPAEELLRQFGVHWITYTAVEGYSEMLDMWGNTLPEFLINLNSMHARIRLTMPSLKPPTFEVEPVGETGLILKYWTERPGLQPMVLGLLEGLGTRFGMKVEAELTALRNETQAFDEFKVEWSPLPKTT